MGGWIVFFVVLMLVLGLILGVGQGGDLTNKNQLPQYMGHPNCPWRLLGISIPPRTMIQRVIKQPLSVNLPVMPLPLL